MKTPNFVRTSLINPIATDDYRGISRFSIGDSIFSSLMVGCGETYIVTLAISMNVAERTAGLLAVIPVVLGAMFQLFSATYLRSTYTPRQWVVGCTVVQSLSLASFGLIGIFMPRDLYHGYMVSAAFFIIATIYWSSSQASQPTWNVWIGLLIPEKLRLSFFNRRNRMSQFATLFALVTTGLSLKWAAKAHQEIALFSCMMFIAGLLRFSSGLCLFKHPDVKPERDTSVDSPIKTQPLPFRKWIMSSSVLVILLFHFLANVGIHFSGPFFTPYIVKNLSFSYADYTILIGSVIASRALTAGLLTRLGERFGIKFLLICGTMGIAPIPWAWGLSPSFGYLVVLEFIAGFAWACYDTGLMLYLMESVSHTERARMLSWCNVVSMAGMLSGSTAAAVYVGNRAMSTEIYEGIFIISSLLRLVPLPFLVLWFCKASPGSFRKRREVLYQQYRDTADRLINLILKTIGTRTDFQAFEQIRELKVTESDVCEKEIDNQGF